MALHNTPAAKIQCPLVRPHQPSLSDGLSLTVLRLCQSAIEAGFILTPSMCWPGNALQQGVTLKRSHSTTSSSGSKGTRLPHLKSGLQLTAAMLSRTRAWTALRITVERMQRGKKEFDLRNWGTNVVTIAWNAWRSLSPAEGWISGWISRWISSNDRFHVLIGNTQRAWGQEMTKTMNTRCQLCCGHTVPKASQSAAVLATCFTNKHWIHWIVDLSLVI